MTETHSQAARELSDLIRSHAFFANLPEGDSRLVCGCARHRVFGVGDYLLKEGQPAKEFYLIRDGRVALEIHAPGQGCLSFQTLGAGEVVGVSWLIAPYRWSYDARALEPVRAIGLNAECLRGECEADHDFGYTMMQRFVPMLVQRLQATRLQLLDVYGRHD